MDTLVRQPIRQSWQTYLTNHNVCGLTADLGVIRDEVLRNAIDTLTATVRALMRRCAIVNVPRFSLYFRDLQRGQPSQMSLVSVDLYGRIRVVKSTRPREERT